MINATLDSINVYLYLYKIDWNEVMTAIDPLIMIANNFIQQNELEDKIKRFDHIIIEEGFDINKIINFFKKYTFQTSNVLEWKFENKEKINDK